MLHNFEYAQSVTVEELLLFPIMVGVLQLHSENSGFDFPDFHILSTQFDFFALVFSDSACDLYRRRFLNFFFKR